MPLHFWNASVAFAIEIKWYSLEPCLGFVDYDLYLFTYFTSHSTCKQVLNCQPCVHDFVLHNIS